MIKSVFPIINISPGWEIKLEGQLYSLQQEAKVLKKEKHKGICWDEKTKTKQQTSLTMQLEEISQKKGDLKDFAMGLNNTNKTEH